RTWSASHTSVSPEFLANLATLRRITGQMDTTCLSTRKPIMEKSKPDWSWLGSEIHAAKQRSQRRECLSREWRNSMKTENVTPRARRLLFATAVILQVVLFSSGKLLAAGRELPELRRPLSKVEALNLALTNNGTIRQAQKEVEAAEGIAIQTRAILFPKLLSAATYMVRQDSLIEANRNRTIAPVQVDLPEVAALGLAGSSLSVGGGQSSKVNNQFWDGEIRIVQSIYEGGRMLSAVRSARLIREQAWLSFQSTVADTLLSVANAYDDALGRAKQVEVREQQVTFLIKYRDDTKARLEAGTVPEFDVIRQEVEVANGTAQLVEAQGGYRVAKQKLVELLGYDLPTTVTDNLPLHLTTALVA